MSRMRARSGPHGGEGGDVSSVCKVNDESDVSVVWRSVIARNYPILAHVFGRVHRAVVGHAHKCPVLG